MLVKENFLLWHAYEEAVIKTKCKFFSIAFRDLFLYTIIQLITDGLLIRLKDEHLLLILCIKSLRAKLMTAVTVSVLGQART